MEEEQLMSFPSETTEFDQQEFSYSADEVSTLYAYNYNQYDSSTATLYTASDVDPQYTHSLQDEMSEMSNWVVVDGQNFQLSVRIFVSRNDSYLQKMFDRTKPNANEVCLFLEDNRSDTFSDRSYYIKVGSIFQKFLAENKDRKALKDILEYGTQYEREDNDISVKSSFSETEILELIEIGQISGIGLGGSSFLEVYKKIISWATWPFTLMGEGIHKVTDAIKYYCKFSDQSWDPETKRTDGSMFEPILFSWGPKVDENDKENILATFINAIKKYNEEKLEYFDRLINIPIPNISESLNAFYDKFKIMAKELKKVAQKLSDSIIDNIGQLIDYFMSFGDRMLQIINAYYCGLWNSLIDMIIGIPELLGWLFRIQGMPGQIVENIDTILPKFMETLDEVLQLAIEISWVDVIWEVITNLGKGLVKMLTSAGSYVSLERIAYFIGAVAGFIVENLIGLLFSMGLININSIANKLGKFGKFAEILAKMIGGFNRAVDAAVEPIIHGIIRVVGWILRNLRKGAKAIGRMIRSLFNKLDEAAELASDLILQVLGRLGFSRQNYESLKSVGIIVTDIAEDGSKVMLRQNCRT